jgi:hypothetical protein
MSKFNKFNFFILAFICLTLTLPAQVSSDSPPKRSKNGVYMTVGGGATYISYEFERLFGRSESFFGSAGAGLGAATVPDETNYATMPLHISGNAGKGSSFFEFGIGTTLIFNNPDRNSTSYLILGYRLSRPKKHKLALALRINLNIPFGYYNAVAKGSTQFIPLGLGLGIAF